MPKKTPPDHGPTAVAPSNGGRPTSFRDEYLEQTLKLCALGATDEEVADFFDVSIRTLNRWKVTRAGFAEALRRGKDPADDRIEASLYHRAQDREVEEEQAIKLKKIAYGPDGKKILEEERVEIVKVKKLLPADTTAMIFWLKNRRSQEWRDVHKHEHGQAGAFDHLKDDQLREFIVLEAQEISEKQPALLPPPKRARKQEPRGKTH